MKTHIFKLAIAAACLTLSLNLAACKNKGTGGNRHADTTAVDTSMTDTTGMGTSHTDTGTNRGTGTTGTGTSGTGTTGTGSTSGKVGTDTTGRHR